MAGLNIKTHPRPSETDNEEEVKRGLAREEKNENLLSLSPENLTENGK